MRMYLVYEKEQLGYTDESEMRLWVNWLKKAAGLTLSNS